MFSCKGIIDIWRGRGKREGQFRKFDMNELIIHQKVTSIAGLVKMWLVVHSPKKKKKKEKKRCDFLLSVGGAKIDIRVVQKRVGIWCLILF